MPNCLEDGCKAEAHEDLLHCLPHERIARAVAIQPFMTKLKRDGIEPPLCDAEGCDMQALLDGLTWAGSCDLHASLPSWVALSAQVLESACNTALQGMIDDSNDEDLTSDEQIETLRAGIQVLTAMVQNFVDRVREEEAKREEPPAGRILGKQRQG